MHDMSKTVIQKAKELIECVGKDEAKKVFEKRIKEIGVPKSFDDVCTLSGLETAIEYVNGKLNSIK